MEYKIIAAGIATTIGLSSSIPYLIDTIKGRTKPHAYTWLIWTITQGIAAVGVLQGGGGWSGIGMSIGAGMLAITFLLSLRLGTRFITAFDTVLLCGAIAGLVTWYVTANTLYAVLIATAVDFLGYLPTLIKVYKHPGSETASTWGLWVVATALALIGLQEYNLLTVPWLLMCLPMNAFVFALSLRKK
jgi:hypothetical protein